MSKKDPSALENYLVYGVDFFNRRLYFGYLNDSEGEDYFQDDVGFTSIALAIRGIDKMLDFTNKEPIEIHMTSYGGNPYQMMSLVDKIQECPCPVKFFGRGRISSAATWIMAVCDERYLAENTTVMIHDGSDGFGGKTTDMDIYTDENNRLQDLLNRMYVRNSRMPLEFWEAIVRRDLYLTAEETIALGLADAIIPYRGRAQFRKGVRKKNLEAKVDQKKLSKLAEKLFDRVKMSRIEELKINIPEETEEKIDTYDNTEAELKKLDDSDKV